MNNKLLTALAFIGAMTLLAACGGSGGDEDDGPPVAIVTTNYQVVFSPDQVIGALVAPNAISATALFSSAEGEDILATGSVNVSGVSATAVTINVGYAGENGPIAVALTNSGSGVWSIPAGTFLDFDELARLQVSGYYVSVETPSGALRGQILPPNWAMGMVELDGASVVPPSGSIGTGKAGFAFDTRNGRLRVRVTLSAVGDAISGSIRNAIAGARGEAIASLEVSLTDASVWGTRDINNPDAGTVLGLSGFDMLVAGALYASIESTTNMDGELRGQIVDDSIQVFETALTVDEVVTVGGLVVSSATGVATVTWAEVLSSFGISVNTDIENALSVSVNQGPVGENGTLLFSLTPDSTLTGNWVLSPTELDTAQASSLQNNEFYVSIVTAAYADGELRGQILP